MKKRILQIAALAWVVTLGACSGEEPNGAADLNVTFNGSLVKAVRAGDNYFDQGDLISVFGVETTSGQLAVLKDVNRFDNVKYEYNGEGRFVPSGGYGIVKGEEEQIAYVAIYPYSETNGSKFNFSCAQDQSVQNAYTKSDLCTASSTSTAVSNVDLVFYHRLSQIVLNISGDDLTELKGVELNNFKLSTSVDINNMEFAASGQAAAVVKPVVNGLNCWKAVVAPQAIEAGTVIATVRVGDKEIPLKTQVSMTLGSGKSYEFNAVVKNEQVVEFTGTIMPWNSSTIENVVPEEVREQWGEYITIHDGINPPNIEGCFIVTPFITVFCSDYPDGGFEPGYEVNAEFMRFFNQNTVSNTLDYEAVSKAGTSYLVGNGAFISGSGNDFTVFFNTEGESYGIYVKQALVISGTKTPEGIKNLEYAFVMNEKGDDPTNELMEVNAYRVFKDGDGISEPATWPGINHMPAKKVNRGLLLDMNARLK